MTSVALRSIYIAKLFVALFIVSLSASTNDAETLFLEKIKPVMEQSCFICHDEGSSLGNISFHNYESDRQLIEDKTLWMKVLKNIRAGAMPPNVVFRPSEEDREAIYDFIKFHVFKIDPSKPDPGHVTLRRLNRVEYQNTIRDLMGVEFNAVAEFPPDDTGYGFDTIGDVLSVSPLLLEKYVKAAESIVKQAVPTITKVRPERQFTGRQFRTNDRKQNGDTMDFYQPLTVSFSPKIDVAGSYHLELNLEVDGAFDSDPGECVVVFRINGEERLRESYGWHDRKQFNYSFEESFDEGRIDLEFELIPQNKPEDKKEKLDFEINTVTLIGPMEKEHWHNPNGYDRFFHRNEPPKDENERFDYAQEVMSHFAEKAYRRPVDDSTARALAAFAREQYSLPGKNFEQGIAQAMAAVLASPRFLFRIEGVLPPDDINENPLLEEYGHPQIDEFSLASRLSYFLWSTMPDEELYSLARKGRLRDNLETQVARLLNHERSEEFVHHFLGQWLHVRDVEHVPIDVHRALERPRRRGEPRLEFDKSLRVAMRRETEHMFRHIMLEDRSLLEMLEADYTFLNEELAKHYGIDGVEGGHFRKVDLPDGDPRGGVLTQGSVLAVTSNPTRTSPVKRGLFIVENILGGPVPPPPPVIPGIEEAEKELRSSNKNPTTRDILELHRSKPECAACHARFDPPGMSLENFNALGLWRDTENGQSINASGELISGESFNNINDIKSILIENHRMEFYRNAAKKMLTYAIGRGMQDFDTHTIDQIAEQVEADNGRFSTLLFGVIHSAPFQRQRALSSLDS